MNDPGALSFNMAMACSLEISALYQNLEVSWTNFTITSLSFGLSGKGEATSEGLQKSGRTFGKGMLIVLPLWGLEKPLEEGETEPKERSPSEALFFSGRGGCPGRLTPWFCRPGL